MTRRLAEPLCSLHHQNPPLHGDPDSLPRSLNTLLAKGIQTQMDYSTSLRPSAELVP